MTFNQSAVSSSDNSKAEATMPVTQPVYPLSVSPTSPKTSTVTLHDTPLDSSHHDLPWDPQIGRPHRGEDNANMITSTAWQATDDQCAMNSVDIITPSKAISKARALACIIADKVLEVLEKLEQQICFQDWPVLDEIKENINGALMNDFVMHFIEFENNLDICYSNFMKTLEQYEQYLASIAGSTSGEINPEQIENGKKILEQFVEIDDEIGKLGYDLQDKMERKTDQVLQSIGEYKDYIESEQKFGWKCQQTIEAEQQWMEVIAPSAIPQASGLVGSAANALGNMAILDVHLDHKEQLEVVAVHQEMYAQEKVKVIELEQSIVKSRNKIREICSIWQRAKNMPELIKPAYIIAQTLPRMPSADITTFLNIKASLFQMKELLVALKDPIRELVVQLTSYYQPGVHVVREVKAFNCYVPDIVRGLNLLLSAKNIISDGHEEYFERAVLDLCAITSHQVQEIKHIYGKWMTHINPEGQDILCRLTEVYETQFQCQIEKIRETLMLHICQVKSNQARKERNENDRYYKTWDWEGRPVVDSDEALDALRRVKCCVLSIYHLSVLSATAQDQDGDQTSHNWAQLEGLPNDSVHACHSPKTTIPTILSSVASALDHLMVSMGRKTPGRKPKQLVSPTSMLIRLKRRFFPLKKT